MSDPIHISELPIFKRVFDPRMLSEQLVDDQVLLQFEKTFAIVKDYCAKHKITWHVEFDEYREMLHEIVEKADKQTDEELIERCKKGNEYIQTHKDDIKAMVLLAGIEHRLKKRGYNIRELLTQKTTFEQVFGDMIA